MQLSDVRSLLVVGAGQMGQGIAEVCAVAGYAVGLADRTLELAEAGRVRIERSLARAVEKQKLAADAAKRTLERIECRAFPGAENADVAIEAVSEDPALKQSVFETLDTTLPPHALLFSNTSSISITRLAAHTRRPERVLGMHFMNPVPVMQLVELVRGVRTEGWVLELAKELAARLGKSVVVSEDRPGFIVNRVLIPLLNEACFALQEGVASAEDIDQAVRLGLNHPLGPLALCDLIGLDTVLSIAEVLHREIGDDKYRPASLLRNLVAAGRLGKKSGRGFYSYPG